MSETQIIYNNKAVNGMTEEEIRSFIDKLNQLFDTECLVSIHKYLEYGQGIYYLHGTIHISRSFLQHVTNSILCHEFAHHIRALVSERRRSIRVIKHQLKTLKFDSSKRLKVFNTPKRPRRFTKPKRQKHHTPLFAWCLSKVIERAGIEYDFSREYKCVIKRLTKSSGKSKDDVVLKESVQ